jgi:hypothetical protein
VPGCSLRFPGRLQDVAGFHWMRLWCSKVLLDVIGMQGCSLGVLGVPRMSLEYPCNAWVFPGCRWMSLGCMSVLGVSLGVPGMSLGYP